MKKTFKTVVMGAAMAVFITSAQAAIQIQVAKQVRSGVAFIKGKGVAPGAEIAWAGGLVTTANNKNGEFSFFGVLPDDCTGMLSDGNETESVTVVNCTPVASRTPGDAPAPVPRTGQMRDTTPGSDGALQKGVVWPIPRFTDNANGTVTDNLTGLIWLKNANCFKKHQSWHTALDLARSLADGACGLSDGSAAGDWRMPNRNELTSLLDLGEFNPALPRGNPFTNFQFSPPDDYWSSTATGEFPKDLAWAVGFRNSTVREHNKANSFFVTFVRGP